MTMPSGPSAAARWAPRPADPASRTSGTVLTVPDATDPGLAYYLPDHLHVATGDKQAPMLSLTILLDGMPDPADPHVEERLTGGTLALDVTLGCPVPAAGAEQHELRPLFARRAVVELLAANGRVLASATGSGAGLRVALAATLGREELLAVLRALDGLEQPLSLRARVMYRAVGPSVDVRLTGSWTDVHDALLRSHGEGASIAREDLDRAYSDLLARGVLTLNHPESAAALYGLFAAMGESVLLTADGCLGRRPSEAFSIDLSRKAAASKESSVEIGAPLERTLNGALDGFKRDQYISLVSMQAPAGKPSLALSRTPRRVRAGTRDFAAGRNGPLQLLTVGGGTLVAPARLHDTQDQAVEPHRLLALGGHRIDAGEFQLGRLDDDIVAPPEDPPAPLPLVDDESGWAFADRVDPGTAWYVPSFELLQPSPSNDATTSPFVFSFARSGATSTGQPGLDATVTFRLREVRGTPAEEALAARGNPPAQPVSTADASVTLELPFRDEAGATRSQRFPARVTRDGDVLVASVDLIDAWARLCYGALSVPGFQLQPARVEVAWSFPGYVALRPWEFEVSAGAKAALIHLAYTPRPLAAEHPRPYLDIEAATLRSEIGDYALRPPRNGRLLKANATLLVRPDLVIARPPTYEPTYSQRTFLRSQSFDLTVPCSSFGACYVERRPEGDVAIGCRDALRLGETSWRQYEEVTALADPAYRVYRSLQQPGRFLVVPTAYRVSRHPPTDPERAYRPLILLYALLDPERSESNRVIVEARLQADLTPAVRARLRDRLSTYAAEPVIVFPTDVECSTSFVWNLSVPGMGVTSTLQPDGIAVSFSSDLADALLLRDLLTHTGVPGSVAFTFPDGSTLTSGLLVSLREMTGPYLDGPVGITLTEGQASLVNRIERPLDVIELLVAAGGPHPVAVPVEQSLAPGATTAVGIPPAATDVCAAYTLPPGGPVALEEVRAFVEDISTNVLFLDLVDHAARGVASLALRARLAGVPGEQEVPMTGAPAAGSAAFVLPLTTYLSQRVLQYQATVTAADGSVRAGRWVDWDLDRAGALVSLTWDALALPDPKEPS